MAHTSSGVAAMSMLACTSLMCQAQASGLPRCDVLERLEIAQGPLDRGVERVQAHAEQRPGAVVAREQVAPEAAHQRLDQRRVLAGDGGRDPARHGSEAQWEVEPWPS